MDAISHFELDEILDAPFSVTPFISETDYKQLANDFTPITLSYRNVCDLELLLNGGLAPLEGFMNKVNYESVLESMHLVDGQIFPMPITLDVDRNVAESINLDQEVALRDRYGFLLAVLKVTDIWKPNKQREALTIYNTVDETHVGVNYLYHQIKEYYIAGSLTPISSSRYFDFKQLRHTKAELENIFSDLRWKKIMGFQASHVMHRQQQQSIQKAMQKVDAKLLINCVLSNDRSNEMDYSRVQCYQHIIKKFKNKSVQLNVLPFSPRMAGPKEAILHAMINKNYGCTHFMIGRDHASPEKNHNIQTFYRPYDAQTLALQYQHEMGIEIIAFGENKKNSKLAFLKNKSQDISAGEIRDRLEANQQIPDAYSFPEVINELKNIYPLRHKKGLAILLRGESSALLAHCLASRFRELTTRQVTVIDNEILFTCKRNNEKEQKMNNARLAMMAREITKHGGVVICEIPNTFADIKEIIYEVGGVIEVYLSAMKAEENGIYFDMSAIDVEVAVDELMLKIKKLGYLASV